MNQLQALIAEAADSPPEPGDFRELGESLVWIRLPIPGPLNHINVWLLATGTGWLLVDTGMAVPSVEEAWRRLEAALPRLEALERILVTHHHPDHFGMAAHLSAERGVEVMMSESAAAAARPDPSSPDAVAARLEEFADRLGLALEPGFAEFLSGQRYRSVVSGMPVREAALAEGDEIDTAVGPLTVSLHHGHAPGHACLHAAEAGFLVSGDQVLPTISPNISLYPGVEDDDPLGRYLESLERLASLPAGTMVLPAHGRPFSALEARLGTLREEHERRLERTVQTCRGGASTADVVGSLFRLARLDPLNRLLATTETLAHLRHLERRGRVTPEGRGPDLRWVAG